MGNINENRGNTQKPGLSLRECELVQEFAKAKLAANSELQYEDLDDYEIPPRTHFSMLNKPAVSIITKSLCSTWPASVCLKGLLRCCLL